MTHLRNDLKSFRYKETPPRTQSSTKSEGFLIPQTTLMARTAVRLLIAFLCSQLLLLLCNGGGNVDRQFTTTHCPEQERRALEELKQGLTDPDHRLSSWTGSDCCSWAGVRCDNRTGHVVRLNLRNPHPFHPDLRGGSMLNGEIPPSLLDIKHLKHLDLSRNSFGAGAPIPYFLGYFNHLKYLNLSGAGFRGALPPQLANLSSLRYLDLSFNDIHVDSFQYIARMTSLQHLNMESADLGDASDWLESLNMLPSIVEIRLPHCELGSFPLSLPHLNFTSLSVLDLSDNYVLSDLPYWFFNITSLEYLDLGGNRLRGSIPVSAGNLASLNVLNLSFNSLEGGIPQTMKNLCNRQKLGLNTVNIGRKLTELREIFTGCMRDTLEELFLSKTSLTGYLPDWLGEIKRLKSLDLSHNFLYSPILRSLGRLPLLQYLALGDNKLTGTVPESLGHLSNLIYLSLANNNLQGVLSEVHFAHLARLGSLLLASNSLNISVSSDWVPPFRLSTIDLGSCGLGPQFPPWLRTQVNYTNLNLSNTAISDKLPDWFWNLSSQFAHIDLSYNEIKGKIPTKIDRGDSEYIYIDLSFNKFEGMVPCFPPSTRLLDLSENSLSGPIPPNIVEAMPELEYLFLSSNNINGAIPTSICNLTGLSVLDLSGNHLSGNIPICSKFYSDLFVLDLSGNNLSGGIPNWVCFSPSIQSLHLSYNNLSGVLPSMLRSCVALTTLDLSQNKFTGSIPSWIGDSLPSLRVLSLRSNMLAGGIPQLYLPYLQILDLSHNYLSGPIPHSIGNLTAMKVRLNTNTMDAFFNKSDGLVAGYEENMLLVLKGRQLLFTEVVLSFVTTIDLSDNCLSGSIPEELATLVGLISLNLSGNHLTGDITEKFGGLSWLETFDLSRNELSGAIPGSLSQLIALESFNLSCNNLSGRIPSGNQLQIFGVDSYVGNPGLDGNPGLCEVPLIKKCRENEATGGPANDDDEMFWLYICLAPGFVVGLWTIWGVLILKRKWRFTLFRFVDAMCDKVYVAVAVHVARLKRKTYRKN